MNNISKIISLILIIIGIIIQVYSIFLLFNSDFVFGIILLITGIIILYLGRLISNFKKNLFNILISLSILFLSLFLTILPISNSSENISESIQPSIDYVIVNSYEEVIENFLNNYDSKSINLVLSENQEIETIYSSNMTPLQANLLLNELGLDYDTQEERTQVSKIIVRLIYYEIQNSIGENELNIPLSILKEEYSEDIELLQELNYNEIEQVCLLRSSLPRSLIEAELRTYGINYEYLDIVCEENLQSRINLILSSNSENVFIESKNISLKNSDLIWNNLELKEENVSSYTKKILLETILTVVLNQQEISLDTGIPISMFSNILEQEYKEIIAKDYFSNNSTIRIKTLQSLRDTCQYDDIVIEDICEPILMTNYNNLLEEIQNNQSLMASQIENINVTQILTNVESTNKIEENISKLKTISNLFLVLFVFMIIVTLLFGFRFIHLNFLDTIIDISKNSSISLFFYTIISGIVFFIFRDFIGPILERVSKEIPGSNFDLNIITAMPLFLEITQVLEKVFSYHLIGFFIFLIIFAISILYKKYKNEKAQEPKIQ